MQSSFAILFATTPTEKKTMHRRTGDAENARYENVALEKAAQFSIYSHGWNRRDMTMRHRDTRIGLKNVRPDNARNGEYGKPIIHKYMCFVDFKKAFDPFSLGDYDGHGISCTLD